MLKSISIFSLLVISIQCFCQTWQWTEVEPMPLPTANNAVCEAAVGGNEFVYSFGGITTGKTYADIHLRSFKYSVNSNTWEEIDPLPDALTKIASGASFVKDKIYILGGYHVYSNGNEVSSNKVHIYNPQTDLFETDGTPIPIPIDDHIQCVYNDSLIFVVTGWSNTGNVPNVQIYDPSFDTWQVGNSTPFDVYFTAFGASGYISGDTIYYHGGASGGSFGARNYLRKGFINPTNPTDITWLPYEVATGINGYRSACSGDGSTVFWVGGSSVSYNYNGIAYNGSGGVAPSARVLHYKTETQQYIDEDNQPFGVMDLRGIAKLSNNRWVICGGMDSTQTVTTRTFLLKNNTLELTETLSSGLLVKEFENYFEIVSEKNESAQLIDLSGRLVQRMVPSKNFTIEKSRFKKGIYLFVQGTKSIRISI